MGLKAESKKKGVELQKANGFHERSVPFQTKIPAVIKKKSVGKMYVFSEEKKAVL